MNFNFGDTMTGEFHVYINSRHESSAHKTLAEAVRSVKLFLADVKNQDKHNAAGCFPIQIKKIETVFEMEFSQFLTGVLGDDSVLSELSE